MSTTTTAAQPAAQAARGPSFKADLLYGASGTYKTSQIGRAAKWYFERTGKRTRLISADPGGFEPLQHLVDEGVIDVWVLLQEQFMIEAIDHACQGRWPKIVDGKRVLHMTGPEEWQGIALVAFEGLTSFGDAMMKRLRDTRAKLAQDPSYVLTEGSTTYAGGNMTYYGFVQDQLRDRVTASSMLPCDKVIWTALEGRGEEEGTKAPVFGPSIAGKKSIGKCPQWFGNLLHMETAQKSGAKDEKTGQIKITSETVMYLRPHADPNTQIPFPAKTRAPFELASELPDYMEPKIEVLYEKLDALKERARAGLRGTAK